MPLLRTLVALALAAPPTAASTSPATTIITASERDHHGPDAVESPESAPAAAPDAEPSGDALPIVPVAPAAAPPEPPPQLAPTPESPPPITVATEGPADDSAELPYDPLVDSPEAIRARHWVRSGIVFMVVGGVLSIGAIAMSQATVNDPEVGSSKCSPAGDPAGNGCTRGGRQRATAALAVPGGLLLAGGIAMLTVGKLQQKRLAASLRADRRSFYLGVALRF